MYNLVKVLGWVLIVLLTLILISLIIIYPNESLSAALEGFNTWINIVLPALLPFFILSGLMIQLGVVDIFAFILDPIMKPLFNCPGHTSFIWIMSITSGYPMGAKLIASLYKTKSISKVEAKRMMAFCNTSGPLFMIGAVGIGILHSPSAGIVIAISHYIASILLGLCFRFYGLQGLTKKSHQGIPLARSLKELTWNQAFTGKPLGIVLRDSIKEAMEGQILIGGFIVLFSVFTTLLMHRITMGPPWIKALGAGIIEITTGSKIIGGFNLPFNIKLIAISFIIGWGGLSVHAQVAGFISETDIPMGLYYISKLLHGIIAATITYLYTVFYGFKAAPVISLDSYTDKPIPQPILFFSLRLIALALIILMTLILVSLFMSILKPKKSIHYKKNKRIRS